MLKQSELIKNDDSKLLGNWTDTWRADMGFAQDTVSGEIEVEKEGCPWRKNILFNLDNAQRILYDTYHFIESVKDLK